MKINYKFFSVFALIALMFSSCDEGDAVVDDITANTTRGAILRTVNLISNEIPIGTADASFSVELEVQDQENGGLSDAIEVYLGFRDNTVEDGATDLDKDEQLITTLDVDAFDIGEFGLPRTTYAIGIAEMLSTLGLDDEDLDGGDQFTIRFELILKDGRRFSFDQNSGTLTGSFFASPWLYTPTVVCPVAEDFLIGDYNLTTTAVGIFGSVVFPQGTVSLMQGESSSDARFFNAQIYPDLGSFGNIDFNFNLVCGNVVVPGGQATGVGCGTSTTLGPSIVGTYDLNDDSTITINFADDEGGGGCGSQANAVIVLTKL